MTLYQRIAAAGIPHANHESDLYVPDTNQVRGIIMDYNEDTKIRVPHSFFWNHIEKEMWIDIPFAYDPWWNERIKRP